MHGSESLCGKPGKELHGHHDETCFMEISAAQGHSRALG